MKDFSGIKKLRSLLFVVLVCAGFVASLCLTAQAATYYKVDPGATVNVDEFSTSKKVTNNNALALFVPTKTSAEWAAFIAHPPADVILAEGSLTIGMSYQGGKIAYFLKPGDPGYVTGETRGLIAASTDESAGIQWNNGYGVYTLTNATGSDIGTGSTNTDAIIASQGEVATSYAAGLARAYNGGGYSDWYLPSINELNTLYINRAAIGGFNNNDSYWSSSDGIQGVNSYDNDVMYQSFYDGSQSWVYKDGPCCLRAVRSFVSSIPAAPEPEPVAIGDNYQGGVVAYILVPGDPGYVEGEIHGLIVAPSNMSIGPIKWANNSIATGATAEALGTGNANTNIIVTKQGAGSYAAEFCADLVYGGYSDWYLPSKDELNKLYLDKSNIGGFEGDYYYWSSSEFSASKALTQEFNNGTTYNAPKSNTTQYYVRSIRSF